MTPGSGAFPQTAGLQMVVEAGRVTDARVQGQAIDAQRDYRVAISNFTASGGDGYPRLADHPGYINTGFVDADVLRAFIAQRSPLKAADFNPPSEIQRR
jgi:5'-nucleotidase/UDP-sugar diphosphatase